MFQLRRIRLLSVILVAAVVFGFGAALATAQTKLDQPHPAQIRSGSCAEIGEVAYPLDDVVAGLHLGPMTGMGRGQGPGPGMMGGTPGVGMGPMRGSPMPGAGMMGAGRHAHQVATSTTTVAAPLADLVSGGYALTVAESAAEPETLIACGDLDGDATSGELIVGLHPVDRAGAAGMTWLVDHGDGTTTVLVMLAPDLFPAAAAAATPAALAEGKVAVDLGDFTVALSQTEFTVGQPYTFVVTNVGKFEHEVVFERAGVNDEPLEANGNVAEIEDLEPGDRATLTWTFTEPGDYQVACHEPGHYEQGMVALITVTE